MREREHSKNDKNENTVKTLPLILMQVDDNKTSGRRHGNTSYLTQWYVVPRWLMLLCFNEHFSWYELAKPTLSPALGV